MKRTMTPHFLLTILLAVTQSATQVPSSIGPGEWFEAAGTRFDAVKPAPLPTGDFAAIMSAWSGGAFDGKRDRLMIWGGGHGDYAGNEVYAFDLGALKWERLNQPSADVGGNESSGVYPDGSPRSRHTYNYVQYVTALDRFCTFRTSSSFAPLRAHASIPKRKGGRCCGRKRGLDSGGIRWGR
jgi:hypothetical protein